MTAATAQPARRRGGILDMALSLGLLLAIIGIVLFVQQRDDKAIKVIDPASAYAGARNVASYEVRTPQALPARWRPTSARTQRPAAGRVSLRVGFVTPEGEYAQLVESDLPRNQLIAAELGDDALPRGSVTVGSDMWQQFPARRDGDRAIVRTDGAVTFIVSGSASLTELKVLAASLR